MPRRGGEWRPRGVLAIREKPNVVVRILDDGPGIPAGFGDRSSIRSLQPNPWDRKRPRLDIARRLVRHNDGAIDFDSQPGGRISSRLPIAEIHPAELCDNLPLPISHPPSLKDASLDRSGVERPRHCARLPPAAPKTARAPFAFRSPPAAPKPRRAPFCLPVPSPAHPNRAGAPSFAAGGRGWDVDPPPASSAVASSSSPHQKMPSSRPRRSAVRAPRHCRLCLCLFSPPAHNRAVPHPSRPLAKGGM